MLSGPPSRFRARQASRTPFRLVNPNHWYSPAPAALLNAASNASRSASTTGRSWMFSAFVSWLTCLILAFASARPRSGADRTAPDREAGVMADSTDDPDAMLAIALTEARTGLAEGGIPIGAALFARI